MNPNPNPRLSMNQDALADMNHNDRTADDRGPVQLEDYRWMIKLGHPDDFAQPGERYRSYTGQERHQLIANVAADLSRVSQDIQLHAICNYFRADAECGMRLAQGLRIDISGFMPRQG